MRSTILVAAVASFAIALPAFAQNAPNAPRTPAAPPPPAVTQSNPASPGANAFTENQAKTRIEAGGYANVSALKKDEKGVWHATAMKDGKSVQVSLDIEGKVIAD